MCFHVSAKTKPEVLEKALKAYMDKEEKEKLTPLFHANGFTHPELPVVLNTEPEKIHLLSWGLIPHYAKDIKEAIKKRNGLLNATCENALKSSTWKYSTKNKRCLVAVDGIYEWMHFNGKTYPHYIHMENQEPFTLGGIWSSWTDKETEETYHTFAIITTPANALLKKIHNTKERMPLVITEDKRQKWLKRDLPEEDIVKLMAPLLGGKLKTHTISRLITSKTQFTNVPAVCIEVDYPELNQQAGLFS